MHTIKSFQRYVLGSMLYGEIVSVMVSRCPCHLHIDGCHCLGHLVSFCFHDILTVHKQINSCRICLFQFTFQLKLQMPVFASWNMHICWHPWTRTHLIIDLLMTTVTRTLLAKRVYLVSATMLYIIFGLTFSNWSARWHVNFILSKTCHFERTTNVDTTLSVIALPT